MTTLTKILKSKRENSAVTKYRAISLLKTVNSLFQKSAESLTYPKIARNIFIYSPTINSCIKEFHVTEANTSTIKTRPITHTGCLLLVFYFTRNE